MSKGKVLIDPCLGCGRTGIRHRAHGKCSGCISAEYRQDPEARVRAARGRRDEVPEVPVCCVECGEQMIEPVPSGLCGFCQEEMAA